MNPANPIGSLFSGYGGLDMAVEAVTGGTTVWHSEIEPGASAILAHHYPGVPNLGDITAVDWATVPPVDILCGGFPCQDVSGAGRRTGIAPGSRSGLWAHFATAIDQLRPGLVVIENVRGLLSAKAHHPAHDALEPCSGCLGGEHGKPALRALGAVLGDLADLGFHAEWEGVRASDVGAAHQRFRTFIVAWPAEDANVAARRQRRLTTPGQAEGGRARADAGGRGGAPAADARIVRRDRRQGVGGAGWDPAQREQAGDHPGDAAGSSADTGSGGRGANLADPRWGAAADAVGGGRDGWTRDTVRQPVIGAAAAGGRSGAGAWGPYGSAVARWERLTRPAPPPSETGTKGQPRLSPAFVEWMMGLPEGWVTAVPGLTRNQQLKALGNGVVPQQAAHALDVLLGRVAAGLGEAV